jgi:hypothetical protein
MERGTARPSYRFSSEIEICCVERAKKLRGIVRERAARAAWEAAQEGSAVIFESRARTVVL